MTTLTRAPERLRLTFGGLVRSELIKAASLRSTRTSALALLLLVAAGIALRAFAFAEIGDPVAIGLTSDEAWGASIDVGTQAGVLAAIVFAVLVMGSEHTDRAARTTFTAAPGRLGVLGAKALVTGVAVAALAAVGALLGIAVSLPLMTGAGLAGPTVATAGAALAAVLALTVQALFALAIAVLARSTAAGITIVLAVLLVLPVAVGLLGAALRIDLGPLLLSYAAPMATAAIHDPAAARQLGQTLPVVIAWLVVPGAAAAALLVRRDV